MEIIYKGSKRFEVEIVNMRQKLNVDYKYKWKLFTSGGNYKHEVEIIKHELEIINIGWILYRLDIINMRWTLFF